MPDTIPQAPTNAHRRAAVLLGIYLSLGDEDRQEMAALALLRDRGYDVTGVLAQKAAG